MWTKENSIREFKKKLALPPQVGDAKRPPGVKLLGGEMSLSDLGGYAKKARKKAAEMGRFFASEYLREPGTQEYWVNKALEKAQPFMKQTGKKAMDQLSTAIRPKKDYITNRKDLDGSGLLSNMVYSFNYAPWTRNEVPGGGFVAPKPPQKGKGVDIHKAIGKFPKPKSGWTLPGHNYTGPYNPLEEQLRFNPNTGQGTKFLGAALPPQDLHKKAKELIFTKQLENSQNQKAVGHFLDIIIQDPIILWKNSFASIPTLEKSWNSM